MALVLTLDDLVVDSFATTPDSPRTDDPKESGGEGCVTQGEETCQLSACFSCVTCGGCTLAVGPAAQGSCNPTCGESCTCPPMCPDRPVADRA